DGVVLGMARGGVPVAYGAARLLELPLDVCVVRKLGLPSQPELAMGALARGAQILNRTVVEAAGVDRAALERGAARQSLELERGEHAYRGSRRRIEVAGRSAIVIDDGLATGSSMMAMVCALRDEGVRGVIAAVPVASTGACAAVGERADEVVCAHTPRYFFSVGAWYGDFDQVSDDEVRELLERFWRE